MLHFFSQRPVQIMTLLVLFNCSMSIQSGSAGSLKQIRSRHTQQKSTGSARNWMRRGTRSGASQRGRVTTRKYLKKVKRECEEKKIQAGLLKRCIVSTGEERRGGEWGCLTREQMSSHQPQMSGKTPISTTTSRETWNETKRAAFNSFDFQPRPGPTGGGDIP